MAYDTGLVARMADALAAMGERGFRQRSVFGGRGFLVGKLMFAAAWEDGIIVKTRREEYERLLEAPGITPFAPGGDSPMGTWLVVPAEVIADDPELMDWLARGLRAVR